MLILRADNDGEGGILSLVALVQRKLKGYGPWAKRLVALGVLGTALFYCDALMTPAISVLSAVEGLELLDARLHRAIVPVTHRDPGRCCSRCSAAARRASAGCSGRS